MRRFVVIVCAAICVATGVAQENSIRVEFTSDATQNTAIGAFRRDGVLFASVNDVAQVLGLDVSEKRALQKIELKQRSFRMNLVAGNAFVVIVDEKNHRSMYQLGGNVIRAAGSYFVPLPTFVRLLNNVFSKNIAFDERTRVLRVGGEPPQPVYNVGVPIFEQKTNGMIIRIPMTKSVKDLESWLRQDGWLYVTIPDVKADVNMLNATKPHGLVKQVVAIQSPNSLQLTFKLSGNVATSELSRPPNSPDILLTVRTKTVEEPAHESKKPFPGSEGLDRQRDRWGLDAIVIDAGHGGRDWGALGVSGVKEKDVTLGISLKLGKLIEKNLKDVKVVYTRKTDKFIELDRRGQIANEADGKLFISIHCNSLKRKPSKTRGFEVYLLRPGRTNEAIAIAERENAVIQMEEGYEKKYQELTEENFILVTMAQSAHVKASEVFADIAQQEMRSRTAIPNRGVKQAGFYVLVGAAMPNVLVETAYLSNREDERYLKSEAGQQKIAESLFSAIKRYKEEYEKLLLEGSDLGQR